MVQANEMHSRLPISQKCTICGAGVLLTAGISLFIYWPWVFKSILDFGLTVRPNSPAFDMWKVNPIPIYLDFYLFNWTNPQDIHNKTIKPKFVEIGPFRFREVKRKSNVTWNDNNDTVSFRHYKTWWFDEEQSVGGLDMNVTTINPVSISGAYQARNWNFWLKKGYQFSLSQFAPKLETTKTVGEFLFYGYEDIFLKISNTFPIGGLPKLDKFGWFYNRNNSVEAEGHYNMDITVENNGQLKAWNFVNQTNYYTDTCAKVGGSAGELYLRNPSKTNISFFSSDLCRMVTLDYDEEVEVKGFKGYKFSALDSFLDNGSIIPENACSCNGECIPYGMLNVSKCKYGAPGFVSLPHFYNADPYYLNMVEGLKPEKRLHEMFITLEPTTGVPLSVAARLQLNLLVQPIEYITLFEDLPKLFFPVLWFEQVVEVPNYLVIPFKLLTNLPTILSVLGYAFIISSTFIIMYVLYTPIYNTFILKEKASLILLRETTPLSTPEESLDEGDIKSDKLLIC